MLWMECGFIWSKDMDTQEKGRENIGVLKCGLGEKRNESNGQIEEGMEERLIWSDKREHPGSWAEEKFELNPVDLF